MKDPQIFNPIEEVLLKGSQKVSVYRSYYPSDASCIVKGVVVGRCLRYQYWRWMGAQPPSKNTWRMALAVQLGNSAEQFFIELYRRSGKLRCAQLPFFVQIMGLDISGRIDGLTKKGELIECKSAFGTAFFNSVNERPKLEHLCQIMVYLACLGLNECILPYLCRDNPSKRQGFRMSKKEIEALGITMVGILARWKKLKEYKERKELPPCDYESKTWQCGYCLFKEQCNDERAKDNRNVIPGGGVGEGKEVLPQKS